MIQRLIDLLGKHFPWFARHFTRLVSDAFVQDHYHFYGAMFGDAVSYLPLGECVDFQERFEAWTFWEDAYSKRGFRTISIDNFVKIGGWGDDATPLLGQRRDPEESVVLHSERYRERYLGKMPPGILQGGFGPLIDDKGNPRVIRAEYPRPSTEEPNPSPSTPKEIS